METKKESQALTKRKPVVHFYDPLLIKEIVNAVEDGIPRRTLVERYGVSQSTLCLWMCKYGSVVYQQNKRRVFKPSEKRSVLRAIALGMSVTQARITFGLKSNVMILSWIRQEQKENADLSVVNSHPMAKDVKNKETEEVKALREALTFAQLKIKALDTLIDIAQEQFKIDIRKKSGARQSSK
ncbi:hypothetical protein [Pedobacter sp.]|uniref:hypothetical protein n=1 Tax=Pedobacter sp. TaxID=1411316 RepID=UPI003D7FBC37